MGRAEILQDFGAGYYRVRLLRDTATMEQQVSALQQQHTAVAAELVELEQEEAGLAAQISGLQAEINALIQQLAGTPPAEQGDIRGEIDKLTTTALEYDQQLAVHPAGQMRAEQASRQSRIQWLQQQVATGDIRDLWCADYTEDMSGFVPTIEINGLADEVLLAPGSREGEPLLPPTRLVPVQAMTVAQAALNWALFTGWQKWLPTYRVSTVVQLESAYVRLALDNPVFMGQSLTPSTVAVEDAQVDYMQCGLWVLKLGDRVVVEFNQTWDVARIIGFVEHPRPCERKEHVVLQFNECATVWCPETETVIVPPTKTDSEAWQRWLSRVDSDLESWSPYSEIIQTTPLPLTESPDYFSASRDSRLPAGERGCHDWEDDYWYIGDNLELSDGGSVFRATVNQFENTPHKVDADAVGLYSDRGSYETEGSGFRFYAYDTRTIYEWDGSTWSNQGCSEFYEISRYYEWDFPNNGAYVFFYSEYQGEPTGLPGWVAPPANTVLKTGSGELVLGVNIYQSHEQHYYWDGTAGLNRAVTSAVWSCNGFGTSSLTGLYEGSVAYNGDRELSFRYLNGPRIVGGIMTAQGVYQVMLQEHGLANNGTLDPVEMFASCTSNFSPDVSYNPLTVAHHPGFSAAVAALWHYLRDIEGLPTNEPMAINTVVYLANLQAVYYIPELELEYPYVIQ